MRYILVLIAVVMIATFAPVWGQNVDPGVSRERMEKATREVERNNYRPARPARVRIPRYVARKSDVRAAERRVSNQISSGFKGNSKQLSEINSSLKQLVDLQTKQAEAAKAAPKAPLAAPAPVTQGTTQAAPSPTPLAESPQGDNPPVGTPAPTVTQPDDSKPTRVDGEKARREMFVGDSQTGATEALQSEDGQTAIQGAVKKAVGLQDGQRVATAADVANNAYKPSFMAGVWQTIAGIVILVVVVLFVAFVLKKMGKI